MNIEIFEYLRNNGFEYRDKSGELYLRYCPNCETDEQGDFSHLSFRSDNGLFRCKKCDYHGNLWKFALDRGHLLTKSRTKNYIRPAERPELTTETDKFYDWYHKNRGISPEILQKFKVGLHKAGGKSYMAYQFYNESGYLINRKYKNCMDKKDQFQEKDAEPIYYGVNFIDFKMAILFVCEGEDDCHALTQIGLLNVVSVPHGASNYTPAMDAVNEKFETIVLLFDNDEPGQKGARKFAEKAGLQKCLNVVLPYKDARECLQNGVKLEEIEKLVFDAKRFALEEIVKAAELAGHICESNSNYVANKDANRLLGGIRGSEFTVWTGHTGGGKTTAAMNLISWCLDSEMVCMVMSFEESLRQVLEKFIMIRSKESLRQEDEITGKIMFLKSEKWMSEQIEALDQLPLYFLNHKVKNGFYDMDAIEQVCRYAAKFYNVKVFLIDHLHYILKIRNPLAETHEIGEYIRRINCLVRELDIHIILIAHPYKSENAQTGKLAKLGLYCIKGSSTIPQEAHNFIVIEKAQSNDGIETMRSRWRMIKSREWKTGSCEFAVLQNRNTYERITDLDTSGFDNKNNNGDKIDNEKTDF